MYMCMCTDGPAVYMCTCTDVFTAAGGTSLAGAENMYVYTCMQIHNVYIYIYVCVCVYPFIHVYIHIYTYMVLLYYFTADT